VSVGKSVTETEFLALPDREKDALIAKEVLGLKPVKTVWGKQKQYFQWSLGEPDYYDDCGSMELFNPLPTYSTDIAAAWEVVEKLAPIVGDFQQADGFFHLTYADSADHSLRKGCKADSPQQDDDDGEDKYKWSAHFHPGIAGEGTEAARIFGDWKTAKNSCARGRTAAEAICLAALKAVGVVE
jgi:hypothetical protein